ncbi:hypothetical protein [Paenibacillus sp. CF384]|uniref:hypothetical protein n=1 Tax=Paenibacillus sp. CF384 TaxID=1884382 RepID=UPI00089D1DE3|nr:hypothetical protein [Paenibacillus sp. CF384]SDW85771.1 hypothetical protein SAMN05518855_100631 [Paenibacillus sp. CF384]
MGIPIKVWENNEFIKEFISLQAVYRYFKSKTSLSGDKLYDPINFGIDDDKPWNYSADLVYRFETTAEHKAARKDRKTRKYI